MPTAGEPTISGPVPASDRAEPMQKTGCSTGHLEALRGNVEVSSTVSGAKQEGEAQVTKLAQDGPNEQGPTPDGIGPSKEPVMGLEPTANPAIPGQNQQIPAAGAAKASVALCPPMSADVDLQAIMEAWPTLPDAMKAGILAMVRAAGQKPDLR